LHITNKLQTGHKPAKKELLAVIVEAGLDKGLDVLASFNNGTARYINQTGKMLIWETTDQKSNELTKDLFLKSQNVVNQIGPWDKPRNKPEPLTRAIVNCRCSADFKVLALIKVRYILIGNCFEIGN